MFPRPIVMGGNDLSHFPLAHFWVEVMQSLGSLYLNLLEYAMRIKQSKLLENHPFTLFEEKVVIITETFFDHLFKTTTKVKMINSFASQTHARVLFFLRLTYD